jgi:iron complex outermembrane recepter protein
MKQHLLLTYFSLISTLLFSQNQTLKIKLTERNNSPVIGANVILKQRSDTTKIQNTVTDTAGIVEFKTGAEKQFLMYATFIGMKPMSRGITLTDKQNSFTFIMEEQTEMLKGVEIVAKKPLITQEDDKTVVDAEQLALASTSALEVMEKTPGLFVDQDGNIYITSSTPAAVYINGREQRMSNADIASMLRVLPPNSIEKIEILRTPSAKYDASGSGGLVNVILKKGVKIGLTGNVSTGMSQGVYGNQYVGFNINNNDGERTSFFNINYTKSNTFSKLENDRVVATNKLKQFAFTKNPGDALSTGFGVGRELGKKWVFNYDGRASANLNNNTTLTESTVKSINSESILSKNDNNLKNTNRSYSFNQGMSSKYKIDTLGSEWSTDVSYNFNKNLGEQDYTTSFFLPQINSLNGNGDWDNKRHFFIAQTDLKYKLPHLITLETGLKTAIQDYKSATEYLLNSKKDDFRTNTYNFKDNINAAYLQGSKKFGEFILKIGARLENTQMSGKQIIPKDTTFNINRTDIFPYVYFSRKVAKIAGYELRSYLVARRSITRPSYENLNPFPRFLDQFLYESGNPSLKPQFTQNYEINISVNEMPIMAFGKNYTQDIFTNVLYPDPQIPLVNYRTYDNLGKNTETYARITGAIPPGKSYFFVVVAQYNHNDYQGSYANSPLQFQRGSWRFFSYHSLKLGKKTNLSASGFYLLKGQLQFYEIGNFGVLNLNASHQFLDKKLVVSLNLSDVFFSNQYKLALNQGGIATQALRVQDSRRLGLNARYVFGIRKKEKREGIFDIQDGGDK